MNKAIKILLLLSLIIFSCSSSESGNNQPKNELKESSISKLAKNKYGDNYILSYNKSKNFVICRSNSTSKIPNNETVNYFVFDVSNNTIINEDKIRNGILSWNSNYEIKIIEIPGIIQKDQSKEYGYIFNVKTKLKTKIEGGVN